MSGTRDLDILVVGEINPDIVISDPDPVPVFGEVERVVGSITLTIGASSAIFAAGAARLGLRVACYGVVGADPFGRFMLDALESREVDVSAVRVEPGLVTGATVILSNGADRAILTAMGAIGEMDVTAVPGALLARTRHLHSGCFYLQTRSLAALPDFFRSARAAGITTSFDTNWDPSGHWDGGVHEMLHAADLFFPNAAEARAISRRDDVVDAALTLARTGAVGRADGGPTVVVKLGTEGALAARADGTLVRVDAFPADPVDTTGAGDSFAAGFLHAWLDGATLETALRWGAACGALSTRAAGGVDGQATIAEVVTILAGDPRDGEPSGAEARR